MPELLHIEPESPELREFLEENFLFTLLNRDEIASIAGLLRRQRYLPGEYVFAKDDIARNVFIVEQGGLELERSGRVYKKFTRGDVFGEIAIIDESFRTGSIRAEHESVLLLLGGDWIVGEQARVDPRTSLKIFRQLSRKVVSYLRSIEQTTTRELIAGGESDRLEFKSSLRWNVHRKKFDKDIEHAALKAIAAFLNSEGGTLIIGVSDDGSIVGTQHDKFSNEDRMLLHFTNLVKERISTHHVSFLHFEVESIQGNTVFRVDCKPATTPAYVRHNNDEYFFVRTGPSSTELRVSELHDYIVYRFYQRKTM